MRSGLAATPRACARLAHGSGCSSAPGRPRRNRRGCRLRSPPPFWRSVQATTCSVACVNSGCGSRRSVQYSVPSGPMRRVSCNAMCMSARCSQPLARAKQQAVARLDAVGPPAPVLQYGRSSAGAAYMPPGGVAGTPRAGALLAGSAGRLALRPDGASGLPGCSAKLTHSKRGTARSPKWHSSQKPGISQVLRERRRVKQHPAVAQVPFVAALQKRERID